MIAKHYQRRGRTAALFIVTASILEALFLLWGAVIYKTLDVAFGIGGYTIGTLIGTLSASFLLASVLAFNYRSRAVRAYYWVAAYWFGCMIFLFGACVLFIVCAQLSFFFSPHQFLLPTIGMFAFGIAMLAITYSVWQGQRAQVVRIRVRLPHIPEFWRGRTAIFLSDIHLGNVRGTRFSEKLVKKINALSPQAVFIGGDIFDGLKCYPERLIAPFKNLKTPVGVYAVSGNHDYMQDAASFFDAIKNVGIRVVENEAVDLNGIQLAGVDYEDSAKKEQFKALLDQISFDAARPSILLKHVPDNLYTAASKGISLTLCGHTHRGQIWPLSHITKWIFKGFDYGLKGCGSMAAYISSGVGTWGAPFRFGTKSEIVEITFD